jgi:hypothetical protein
MRSLEVFPVYSSPRPVREVAFRQQKLKPPENRPSAGIVPAEMIIGTHIRRIYPDAQRCAWSHEFGIHCTNLQHVCRGGPKA